MGKKTAGKKGLEKEKKENEESSYLMEASHNETGVKLHDEDKANLESRREISVNGVEIEASQSEAPIGVDVGVEKKKKKKKKKRHETSVDDVELNACEVEPVIKDNVDGDVIKQKKNKKRCENGGNDIDSSIRQNEDVRESNVDKDKRKKKNKKLQEDSGYSADQNNVVVESDVHVDKKKNSEDRQMNGEEVDRKKKKKHKRDKGGDDKTEVNNATDVEAGKDREDKDKRKKKNKKLHEDSGYSADQNNVVVESDVHVDKKKNSQDRQMNGEEVDRKKTKKRKRDKGGDDKTEVNNASDLEAGKDGEQTAEKIMKNVDNSRKKKKKKKNHSDDVMAEDHTPKETPKKVRFSDVVDVFPPHEGLVRGKRFSREEDEMVKRAVLSYIETRGLGEEGLNMVLHCRSHREIKNCWKEIGAALPWRPHESVYYRAHIIFERDENRKWSPEELELVKKFHAKHGSDWKMLAEALGKHRFHVKDTWRRIKLPKLKKGHWSQEEYQNLFDLVNMDLRLKASEEKITKHGMLRDNISWEAISNKLATRTNALCCQKWYYQLTSPLVAEGKWSDVDDYHLVNALSNLDACCIEDVDWDNLLEHRPGSICLKRWNQMAKHLGPYGYKSFAEQVEVLSQRYCSDVLEAREAYNNSRPEVDDVATDQEHD